MAERNPSRPGPKLKQEIDLEWVTNLAAYGHTKQDIADLYGCSVDQFKEALHPENHTAYINGMAQCRSSVRFTLMKLAKLGNTFAIRHLIRTILKESTDDVPVLQVQQTDPDVAAAVREVAALFKDK